MLLMIVTYHVKIGKRAELLEKLREAGIAEGAQKDKGNIQYDYVLHSTKENQLIVLEKWENQECLDLHAKSPNIPVLMKIKDVYVEKTTTESYNI